MKLVNGIAKYLYEIGHLKVMKRSGWWRMGVRDPESVAEHSYRTAIIGYVLATLEGVNAEKTASICLFHDTAEARVSDLSWVAKRYLHTKGAEQAALEEQTKALPQELSTKILTLVSEYRERSSQEAQLAREADLLECLLQSREYEMQGYTKGLEWAKICREGLQTDTAKNLANTCLISDPGEWFQDIQNNPHLTTSREPNTQINSSEKAARWEEIIKQHPDLLNYPDLLENIRQDCKGFIKIQEIFNTPFTDEELKQPGVPKNQQKEN